MFNRIFIIVSAFLWTTSGQSDEKNSLKILLDNYENQGKDGRPVSNISAPIDVDITFSLIQLLSFDQFNQHLTLTARVTLQWEDPVLKWEGPPESYSINPDAVWIPDLNIINCVERPTSIFSTNLLVDSSGHVTWVRPLRLVISCATNPDDNKPTCNIIFSSWSLESNQMSLQTDNYRIDAGYYTTSNEWELSKTKAEIGTRAYACCPDKEFADLTYTFSLKRRPQKDDDADKMKDNSASFFSSTGIFILLAIAATFL